MLIANFPSGIDEITVEGLTQWDKGQKLQITGLSGVTSAQVHFSYKGRSDAFKVLTIFSSGSSIVDIPNDILVQPKDATAWVYTYSAAEGETIRTIHLPIVPRAKPQGEDYVPTPSEQKALDEMNSKIAGMQTQMTTFINAANEKLAHRSAMNKRFYMYVDGSRSSSGDGFSRETAMKTLEEVFDYANSHQVHDLMIYICSPGDYHARYTDPADGQVKNIKDMSIPVLHIFGYIPKADLEADGLEPKPGKNPKDGIRVWMGDTDDDMAFYQCHINFRYITVMLRSANIGKKVYFDGCAVSASYMNWGNESNKYLFDINYGSGRLTGVYMYRLSVDGSSVHLHDCYFANDKLTNDSNSRTLSFINGSYITCTGIQHLGYWFSSVPTAHDKIKGIIYIAESTLCIGEPRKDASGIDYKSFIWDVERKSSSYNLQEEVPSIYATYSLVQGKGDDFYNLRLGRYLDGYKFVKDSSTGRYKQKAGYEQLYMNMTALFAKNSIQMHVDGFNEQIPSTVLDDYEKAN